VNELLKQRLVGAVVLIALAVIFVPMLFETPDSGRKTLGNALPSQPEQETRDRIQPIELPPPPEPVPEVVEVEESVDAAAVHVVEQIPPPPVVEHREPSPVEEVPAEKSKLPEIRQPDKAATDSVKPSLTGWVVQVASVQNKDNALALKERLRGLGFDSFVEQAKTSKGLLYRVRVGPELQRSNAEQVRADLAQKFALEGIVLQYP
jgi:DedD protein